MRYLTFVGVLSAVILSGGTAMALPVGKVQVPSTAADSLVEQVHGGHGACARGPAGWHYHTRRGVRVACNPRPAGRYWGWQFRDGRYGWWHSRERRWN